MKVSGNLHHPQIRKQLESCQEIATDLFLGGSLRRVSESDTLDGGQYLNMDLPTMFSIGRGPLIDTKKANKS